MQLPEALQPWRDWLEWFSDDLAAKAGDLVYRLHPLLGRFRGSRQSGTPEPDGLGDLHRRGSYERLLSSEWLIAEEVPDEFIRRAATGEHLFLAPRPRARQAEKLIVALFDAGPLQLGAPRLVQVAMWILLARRAQEVGGSLRWGVLQADPMLHEADNAEQLRHLLNARCFEPVSPAHLECWKNYLAEEEIRTGELWLLGAEQPAPAVRELGASHQLITTLDILSEDLEVRMQEGGSTRRMVLPLPHRSWAKRILGGSFQEGEQPFKGTPFASEHRLSITTPPLLAPSGSHIAVPMLNDAGVMLFNIPTKVIHKPGKPRQHIWPNQAKPLALVCSGKTVVGLLRSTTGELHFHQLGRPAIQRPPRSNFEATAGRANYLPAARLFDQSAGGVERFYVLDQAGRLVYWRQTGKGQPKDDTLYEQASQVLGMTQIHPSQLVYVSDDQGSIVVHRIGPQRMQAWHCWLGNDAAIVKEVLFGGGELWAQGFGGCALRVGSNNAQHWMIYVPVEEPGREFQVLEISLPEGWRGIGLVHLPEQSGFALLALNPARDQLVLCSSKGRETLYTSPAAIARHHVCPVRGLVAMISDARQLVVFDVPARSLRLTIDGRGSEHAAA